MYSTLHNRIQQINALKQDRIFADSAIGVEKESLRVSTDGKIAQTDHPVCLGSALTHPSITTDYAEAMMEFVTPPLRSIPEVTQSLRDAQQYVYSCMNEEYFWSTSMPCIVPGEESIRIAEYGTSNSAQMKHVYRKGLGYRYGKVMQVIAGVHFNYSVPESFWPIYSKLENNNLPLQSFQNESYMGLIRNIQRYGWLVIYLFGASPAVCKSFLSGLTNQLSEFDFGTFYQPYATSLRMGDIGYQNNKENEHGVKANYDSLQTYTKSLLDAVNTPCSDYEDIGIKVNGEYRQLNANILQIENEYYTTIRPKQVLQGDETPSHSLLKRGIKYVELRSIDVNAYDPLGINEKQMHFLEALLVFCLLQDSPTFTDTERNAIDSNELLAAHRGREPELILDRRDDSISLQKWGLEICDQMKSVCQLLDDKDALYSQALNAQIEKLKDPELTPSARILADLRKHQEPFFAFADKLSKQHRDYFIGLPPNLAKQNMFLKSAEKSRKDQEERETNDSQSFEAYLEAYYSQQ